MLNLKHIVFRINSKFGKEAQKFSTRQDMFLIAIMEPSITIPAKVMIGISRCSGTQSPLQPGYSIFHALVTPSRPKKILPSVPHRCFRISAFPLLSTTRKRPAGRSKEGTTVFSKVQTASQNPINRGCAQAAHFRLHWLDYGHFDKKNILNPDKMAGQYRPTEFCDALGLWLSVASMYSKLTCFNGLLAVPT